MRSRPKPPRTRHRTSSPDDAPLFGLAPRRVCLAAECHHPRWWALTPPFHPSPVLGLRDALADQGHRLVCSLLHLSSGCPAWPLASPPLFGVRTFLSSPVASFSVESEAHRGPATVRPAPRTAIKYSTPQPAWSADGSHRNQLSVNSPARG